MTQEIARGGREKSSAFHKQLILIIGLLLVVILFFTSLMIGSSHMSLPDSFLALFGQGQASSVRIVQNIRLPRALAALLAGAGLSIAGLFMQSTLRNPLAGPSTMGVSNAAVFGANLSIIVFAGGFLNTNNHVNDFAANANPFATSAVAFIFAALSMFIAMALSSIKSFAKETVILVGIALGAVWTALTTLLQFYATDVGLSAAVAWSFGDLGRATFEMDWIMFAVILPSSVIFFLFRWRFNAMGLEDNTAKSLGVRTGWLRMLALGLSSIITAVCIGFLGIIGFIGVICPHVMRRLVGNNHRYLIPGSILCGSALLLFSDILSRLIGNGTAIPVGAITALLGGPFFLYLVFARKGDRA